MSELIERVAAYQNRLTLDLTEWLISHNKSLPALEEAEQELGALLQCWVKLLVECTLESMRLGEPDLLVDFFVVLRDRGGLLYEPQLWQAALSRLYCCYRNLLRSLAGTLQPVNGPRQGHPEYKSRKCGKDLLEGLERAISVAVTELEVYPTWLKVPVPAFPRFVLN
jgi:hypothetical protein